MSILSDLKWQCNKHKRIYSEDGTLLDLDLRWTLALDDAYDLFNEIGVFIPSKIVYYEYKDVTNQSLKSIKKIAMFDGYEWEDDYQAVVNKQHAHSWLEGRLRTQFVGVCERYRQMLAYLGASERGCPEIDINIKLPEIPKHDPFDDFIKIVKTETYTQSKEFVYYEPRK